MIYCIAVIAVWIAFHIGFRIQVVGRENLIHDRGFIMAPNHRSAIDPVFIVAVDALYLLTHKMVVFGKKELFEVNDFVSWFLGKLGCVPVKTGRDDMLTLERAVESCKKGRGLLLFPEGTRSKDGKLLKPKSGAFVVAAQAGVDMIPCRIIYDTPDGSMKLFCRVKICYGKPIPAEQLKMDGKKDMAKLRENKQLLTQAWEELYAQNCFPGRAAAPAEKEN